MSDHCAIGRVRRRSLDLAHWGAPYMIEYMEHIVQCPTRHTKETNDKHDNNVITHYIQGRALSYVHLHTYTLCIHYDIAHVPI